MGPPVEAVAVLAQSQIALAAFPNHGLRVSRGVRQFSRLFPRQLVLGKWHGGAGSVRKIRFLEPVEASILSNHRRIAPFGLEGGQPGKTGRNIAEYESDEREELGATATVKLGKGACLIIETPGGGGYGKP